MQTLFQSRDGRLRNGWKVLAFLSVLFGASWTWSAAVRTFHIPAGGQAASELLATALVMLVSLAFVRLEKERFRDLGWRVDGTWGVEFLIGTLGGVLLILVAALGAMAFGAVRLTFSGAGAWTLLRGAWLFLTVAFFEEALFRGYLFQRMARGMGFWPAQALMAALFAFAHWHNPGMHGATKAWATLNIGLAAVLLGLCWKRTNSLALPIGVHLGWNWAQGSLLGFGVSGTDIPGWLKPEFLGKPEWMSGGSFGLEAGLPGVIACLLACGAVLYSQRRDEEPEA